MAHHTLIGGTAYEITGGKDLIGGTAYKQAKGRTLVGGTGYDISFGKPCTLTITNYTNSYVSINGTAIASNAHSGTYQVKTGDRITVNFQYNPYNTQGATVTHNEEVLHKHTSGGTNEYVTYPFEFVVTGDTTIFYTGTVGSQDGIYYNLRLHIIDKYYTLTKTTSAGDAIWVKQLVGGGYNNESTLTAGTPVTAAAGDTLRLKATKDMLTAYNQTYTISVYLNGSKIATFTAGKTYDYNLGREFFNTNSYDHKISANTSVRVSGLNFYITTS